LYFSRAYSANVTAMSRIITIALIFALSACATTSNMTARDASGIACPKTEVLYCANNGSHQAQKICSCLTQSAARAMVDSL